MFISLPGESHGLRSLVGLVHWVARSQTWLQWLSTQHTDMNYFERLCVYFWLCLGLRCCGGFSLDAENGGYSAVAFLGFLLQWLLLLGSVAPRVPGFSSCVSWALEHRLCSCDAQAQWLQDTWYFLVPGSNPCLPHWQVDSFPLSHLESPYMSYFSCVAPLLYLYSILKYLSEELLT